MRFTVDVVEPKFYCGAVADEISQTIQEVLSENKRCSVGLAGGGTPSAIYRLLARPPRVEGVEWGQIDLFWGDERWVPHDDPQSNYRMVKESLLDFLPSASSCGVHAVNTALASPLEGARDYEVLIQKVLNNDVPQIDLVLLGMGEDGHTASISPDSNLLSSPIESQPLVVAEPPFKNSTINRITMTPRLLLAAKKIIFMVQGADKAERLKQALNEDKEATIPVHIFRKVAEKVTWLIDSEVGKYL